ncbi:glucosamine-6-phosphate deaminase [Lysinibacillus sp. HST-98]|uniref:glucosamine-6-phosphate deaminase n=1 Tax=Lysinibacillus TaxID=400634 RepID=UPI0001DA4E3C|nr:glucosamine-6-phosphate deaminase [Lysinibacillus capsici]EFI68195.1 glucosamine-6-phosphate deaminase [Lysinibacillus fusiformis ZC1]EKU43468.1 glucosamine-6-phosphate deaminase [Lysinibacillus fusiformis ZB2]MBL3729936.1 glucosamine-6-phosphate deaminase [Lysinibacillus sp. HST-98]MBU5251291.1 glucosamine-6-phosphate deaminase [Lysinibacillus capsici]MED4699704.1 glucosamine-6-phosphate deaminase [Lysinibacillus capsici]
MKVKRFSSMDDLYSYAVATISEAKNNGATTFGLATGGTMEPLYAKICKTDIDFSQCISFNLDEYVGLEATHKQSYAYYMNKHLFNQKPFLASYLPDGLAVDPLVETARYEGLLQQYPLDFQLLGIGQNGHIGFNEPGTSFASLTHLVTLEESTRQANARFFSTIDEVPTQAYTMGIQSIMRAKCILLLAVGEAKREVLERLVASDYTEDVPATALSKHPNVMVLTDLQEEENKL